MKTLLQAIRIHQWVKNLLIFVPMILAHKLADKQAIWASIICFAAFSLTASAGYLINDLVDIENDKRHPTKKNRPLASGRISKNTCYLICVLFLGIALTLTLSLSYKSLLVLLAYFCTSLLYSAKLKKIVLLDVFVLASLYTIRIIAGGFAVAVPVSAWLKAFSMFIFLSLAMVKRFSEVAGLKDNNKAPGRDYRTGDLDVLTNMGTTSGYLSVLVLALYINNEDVAKLYSHSGALWLICPLLLFWISRVWLLTHRGEMHDDPIVFAIRDKTSYLIGAVSALIVYVAI